MHDVCKLISGTRWQRKLNVERSLVEYTPLVTAGRYEQMIQSPTKKAQEEVGAANPGVRH